MRTDSRIVSTSFFLRSAFFLIALLAGIGIFVSGKIASADPILSENALRAAREASKDLLKKIESSSKSARIESLASSGEKCSGDVLSGENVFGKYSVIFRKTSVSGAVLSCGDKVSDVAFMEITGLSGGVSLTIGIRVVDPQEAPTPGNYRCTGGLPSGAEAYSGDESDLSADTSWQYAKPGTSRKCEYSCASGYTRDGSRCVSGGSSPVDGSCGGAAKEYAETEAGFSGSYCQTGNPSPSAPVFPSVGHPTAWKCLGVDGGKDSSCVATRAVSSGNSCSLYTASTSLIPDGYGPPFDELSSAKEPTLTVACSASGAVATAGSSNTYVYKTGFVSHGGTWESVIFSGTPATNNDGWFRMFSTATVPPPPASGQNFIIAFVCQYRGSDWKCGCRDSACTQDYWTIQAYGK